MAGDDWTTTRLTDVTQINPDSIGHDWHHTQIHYIDISSVGEGLIQTPPQLLALADAPSRAKRLIKSGDTVLSTVRPNRRSMFFADHPGSNWVVSTGFAVLRPQVHMIAPRFLYACVFSQSFTKYLISREKGAAYPTVSPEDIGNAVIPLPPLKEQQAIAHILGTLDDKIELNRRMSRTLEEMARAIFKSWFVDFDPVRAKADGRRHLPVSRRNSPPSSPTASKSLNWARSRRGGRVSNVGYHFRLTMGQSPPSSTYNETGKGTPFYQGRTDFGFRYPKRRVYCTAPTRFADPGDTLVSVRAPVGDINLAKERCAVGRGVAAIRHRGNSHSFTYYSMHELAGHFLQFEAEGTVFGCINKADFERLPFCVPPQEALVIFDRIVSPLDDRIAMNEKQTFFLTNIRDTLLPKLVSGELRVPDAERIVVRVDI
jgi:type I restriction enzyme S subunit